MLPALTDCIGACASFETRPLGAPQDEEKILMARRKSPHPERERSEQSKDAFTILQLTTYFP
jgi:hypothetical protein